MRGEARGVKREARGAPLHDVCDDSGREPLGADPLRSPIRAPARALTQTQKRLTATTDGCADHVGGALLASGAFGH
jgi:hypothetical protein